MVVGGFFTMMAQWYRYRNDDRYVKREDYRKDIDQNHNEHKTIMHSIGYQVDELKRDLESKVIETKTGLELKVAEVETSLEQRVGELRSDMTFRIDELKSQGESQYRETRLALQEIRTEMNANQLGLVASVSEMKGEMKALIESLRRPNGSR